MRTNFYFNIFLVSAISLVAACSNISEKENQSLGISYKTWIEAETDMEQTFRGQQNVPDGGFMYIYYNDWGFQPDVRLTVDVYDDYRTTLTKLKSPLFTQTMHLFDEGVRTEKLMLKKLQKNQIEVDAAKCPKIPSLFAKIQQAMETNLSQFRIGRSERLWIDSPDIRQYYFSGSPDELVHLSITEDNTMLFTATNELLEYAERCVAERE